MKEARGVLLPLALALSITGCDRSQSTAEQVFVADLRRLAPYTGQDPPSGFMLRADRGPAFTFLLTTIDYKSESEFFHDRGPKRPPPACRAVVFRCNPRLGKVELASCDDWDQSRDQIMVALPNVPNEQFPELEIKGESGKLVYKKKVVRTAGREALYWAPSFKGTRIAVLSAEEEGERGLGFMPFMGGRGRAKGKRTHALFNLSGNDARWRGDHAPSLRGSRSHSGLDGRFTIRGLF